ncbi:MAG: Lar family restriction alleviation protein [Sphingomicrobium sp.]
MVDQVEPCPFCGGNAVCSPADDSGEVVFIVSCQSCGAEVVKSFEAGAIEQWNTRTAYNPNERLSPANHDCLAKAKPGEPMFIILGRDPDGANIVRLWAQRRSDAGDPDHAGPVFAIADAMDDWRAKGNLPESAPDAANYPPIGVERLREAAPKDGSTLLVQNAGGFGCPALVSWDGEQWLQVDYQGDLRTDAVAIISFDSWQPALARTSPSGLRE